jgi:hypothetical protein
MSNTKTHNSSRIRPAILAYATGTLAATLTTALSAPANTASSTDVVWMNVRNFPTSLTVAADTWAWSAIRSEPPEFFSHRIAADDFILDAETTITRITFFSVEIQPPSIIGGDWYIYADDGTGGPGAPGRLVALESGATLTHNPIGAVHPTLGTIHENIMEPTNLVLPAGRYFLAFRTFQSMPLPVQGKPNNAALTERWTNGAHEAQWNMDVFADGSIAGAWVPMQTFNGVAEQEWAFIIEGTTACYPDCDQSTGAGVLDIFDFLCFQDAFVNADPYACDCDTTTGTGVCDIFDFLCFQNAFVAGCP